MIPVIATAVTGRVTDSLHSFPKAVHVHHIGAFRCQTMIRDAAVSRLC